MSWLDNSYRGSYDLDIAAEADKRYKSQAELKDLISSPVGQITSREQIINAYDLVNPRFFSNDELGRTEYQSMLNALLAYQAQQEASYEEWFNSEQQQAARQRKAGLNPDLFGVDSGQASSPQMPQGSPLEGTMSDAELESLRQQNISQRAQRVLGVISTIGSLVSVGFSAFSSLSAAKNARMLTNVQAEGLELDNLSKFQSLVHGGISSRLADAVGSALKAGESIEIDDWFADESNFAGLFESFAPADTPQYRSLFDAVRKNSQSILGKAYSLNKDVAQGQTDLSSLWSNPYFDDDIVLQVAYTQPVMQAIEDKRILQQEFEKQVLELKKEYAGSIDVDLAVSAFDAKNKADFAQYGDLAEYYEAFDSKLSAEYDIMLKKSNAIDARAAAQIYDNYYQTWKENPTSVRGLAAARIVMSRGDLDWREWLTTFGASAIREKPIPYTDPDPERSAFTDMDYSFGDRWIDLGGVKFGD